MIIEVEDGLKVRFPGRDADFTEGVEIGLLLADLAQGIPDIARKIHARSVEQAVELAGQFGYRFLPAAHDGADDAPVELTFTNRRARPTLSVIQGSVAS